MTPLFGDASGEPYTHHFLHSLLRATLAHLYGEAVASLYSFHSFRSGLATALHAAGVDDAMIQLICRWMCPESLHVYRRMGVAEHESSVRKASRWAHSRRQPEDTVGSAYPKGGGRARPVKPICALSVTFLIRRKADRNLADSLNAETKAR